MTKELFVKCVESMRKYCNWECELEFMSINLEGSPASDLANSMLFALLNGDWTWDDDPISDWGWVGMWCGAPSDQCCFKRKGEWIYLPDAGALYDFVTQMRELGWPEETPKEWLK